MKRIITLFAVLAMTLSVMAQQNQHSNYIGLNLGGGMNTVLYPKSNGWVPGFGYMGELRYTHFFGKHFGIGFGVGYNQANGRYNYNNTSVETGLTHPDNGLTYDLHTVADNWMERQSIALLTVPVELFWRAPLSDKWSFLFGVGGQFELPLNASYDAYAGSVETQGYFPATNVTYRNLPDHGFRVYDANHQGTIDSVAAYGISVIADLGFNYALSNNWGLYLGLYGGYGITNMKTTTSADPLIAISDADASQLDYNGVWASEEISDAHMLYAGAKIGINLGWDCHKSERKNKDKSDDAELTSYDDAAEVAQPVDNVTPVEAPAEQPVSEPVNEIEENAGQPVENITPVEAPAEQPVSEPVKEIEENTNQPVSEPVNGVSQSGNDNDTYGNNATDAAEEARCNARRMNDPELKAAMDNIDSDIEEAEHFADETGDNAALSMVADAKAKAADAKAAYNKGQYCRAYDLMTAAYGDLADSYASDAETYASKSNVPEASQAADDADLYAEAAHKDGLDCAAAASRNAKLNAEIARDADRMAKGRSAAINDPNYADALAREALAMANESGSKPAVTDAKDASGKAYRGNLADSYAACAKSFAESAQAFANNPEATPEAKAAAAEAQRYAQEAAEAARMGDVAGAYRAAKLAQQAAERARGREAAKDNNATREGTPDPETAPIDRASLQKYLDQINATVHFDFSSTEPKFDSKTDLAIRALCRAMKADSRVKVLITGHTDNVGSDESNMTYGKKRAEALKDLMVKQGAPAASISTASKGESQPVVENDTDEHRYQNRRAVITLR